MAGLFRRPLESELYPRFLRSRTHGRAVSLEETLREAIGLLLKKKDPLQRAERVLEKKGSKSLNAQVTGPVLIPTLLRHQVRARDRDRCQFRLPHGEICGDSRWTDH